jgi:hypothetical protein
VFTARYALSPYIKQIRSVFKGFKISWLYPWINVAYSERKIIKDIADNGTIMEAAKHFANRNKLH